MGFFDQTGLRQKGRLTRCRDWLKLISHKPQCAPVCTENSNPGVVVMESA